MIAKPRSRIPLIAICGAALAFGGFVAGRTTRSDGGLSQNDSSRLFAESGLAAAKSGDSSRAYFLLRRAARDVGDQTTDEREIWQAIQLSQETSPGDASLLRLNEEFLNSIDAAINKALTLERFAHLYKLRAVVSQANNVARSDNSAVDRSAPSPARQGHASPGGPAAAAALFREGIAALKTEPPNLARGDLLTAAAMRQLAYSPTEASEIWHQWMEYLKYADEKNAASHETYHQLAAFRDNLDEILLASSTINHFEILWSVRDQVRKEMRSRRARLLANVHDSFNKEIGKASALSIAQRLESFVQAVNQIEPKLAALSEEGRSGDKQLGSDFARSLSIAAANLSSDLQHYVGQIAADLDRQVGEDAKPRTIAPSDAPNDGVCAKQIRGLVELARDLESARLERWLEEGADDQTRVDPAVNKTKVQALLVKATAQQQLRYNHWALSEIYAADTVTNWADRLGRIDAGLLHPAVSALYSQTYDTRIRAVHDATTRGRLVGTILGTAKVDLGRF